MQMPPREYVIEKMKGEGGGFFYAAFWRDYVGMTPFGQRLVATDETVMGLGQMMERHYPGTRCVYVPEDVSAIVAEAIKATNGE